MLTLFIIQHKGLAQDIGIKTNSLGWLILQPNLGAEIGISDDFSINVEGMFGPFTFSQGRKIKIQGVQGEFRHWIKNLFQGPVIGVYGNWAKYDWAPAKYRYVGNMYGVGISAGYSWLFSSHWGLELIAGIGWEHFKQKNKYLRKDPYICYGPRSKDYVGITRLGVNFTYYF